MPVELTTDEQGSRDWSALTNTIRDRFGRVFLVPLYFGRRTLLSFSVGENGRSIVNMNTYAVFAANRTGNDITPFGFLKLYADSKSQSKSPRITSRVHLE